MKLIGGLPTDVEEHGERSAPTGVVLSALPPPVLPSGMEREEAQQEQAKARANPQIEREAAAFFPERKESPAAPLLEPTTDSTPASAAELARAALLPTTKGEKEEIDQLRERLSTKELAELFPTVTDFRVAKELTDILRMRVKSGDVEALAALDEITQDPRCSPSFQALGWRRILDKIPREKLAGTLLNASATMPAEARALLVLETSPYDEGGPALAAACMERTEPPAVRLAGVSLARRENLEKAEETFAEVRKIFERREPTILERQLFVDAAAELIGYLQFSRSEGESKKLAIQDLVDAATRPEMLNGVSSLSLVMQLSHGGPEGAGSRFMHDVVADPGTPFEARQVALVMLSSPIPHFSPEEVRGIIEFGKDLPGTWGSVAKLAAPSEPEVARALIGKIFDQPDLESRAWKILTALPAIEALKLRERIPDLVSELKKRAGAGKLAGYDARKLVQAIAEIADREDEGQIVARLRDREIPLSERIELRRYFERFPEKMGAGMRLLLTEASVPGTETGDQYRLQGWLRENASRTELPDLFACLKDPKIDDGLRAGCATIFADYHYAPALKYMAERVGAESRDTPSSVVSHQAYCALARQGGESELALVAGELRRADLKNSERDEILSGLGRNSRTAAREMFVAEIKRLTPPKNEPVDEDKTVSDEGTRAVPWGLHSTVSRFILWNDHFSKDLQDHLLQPGQNSGSQSLVFEAYLNNPRAETIAALAAATRRGDGRACAVVEENAERLGRFVDLLGRNPDPELKQYGATLARAVENGIRFPLRFREQDLPVIIEQRNYFARVDRGGAPPPTPDEKVALLVYPTADWNGALHAQREEIRQLIKAGYKIRYVEADTENDLVAALRQMNKNGGADLMVFAGHGSQKSFSLGAEDPSVSVTQNALKSISLDDEKMLKEADIGGALKSGGRIIMVSCSTGQGFTSEDNIVNMMRRVFSQAEAQGIFGPAIPTNTKRFEEEDGKITPVYLDGNPVHRAQRGEVEVPGIRRQVAA